MKTKMQIDRIIYIHFGLDYTNNVKKELKNKKIPHCWNNYKIKYQNCRDAKSLHEIHKYMTDHFHNKI